MVYWTSFHIFKFIIKIFFRGKCYNRENIPKNGPFIGIINHSSLFEIPAALTLAFKHRAATMVKHSLFSVPVLGWWLNAVDMLEMKAMMNLLSGH
ncbi:1-acyl-sn-glycerol-3-phosphate acyltransferase [candidate division KSB1 bacterium]|nr:1-acyl-sn-glycerol-3-phosphate acyltransferase [candidate division KSB1 bacterium]MCH7753510.1 1-acyl-sn-glycerol-3-phosphate acyltransferase [candidate division KSB1 bacterium]MCH8018466.1 1-acyl-sn-glycerol-3-phosphate acyltransferase [candidate division KSB1 bacterium]